VSFSLVLALLTTSVPAAAQGARQTPVTATLCVPADLERQGWSYPYPGGKIDIAKRGIEGYLAAEGDAQTQYRVRSNAVDSLDPTRQHPRELLDTAGARQACPSDSVAHMVTVRSGAARSPSTPPAAATPLPADAALLTQRQSDKSCDALASAPIDKDKVGNGVTVDRINVSEALPACRQEAERQPARPRYQYLYGRVLIAAKQYDEAAARLTAADRAGSALGTFYLASLSESGQGVRTDLDEAIRLYRKAGDAGIPDGYARIGGIYMASGERNAKRPEAARDFYAAAKDWLQRAADRGAPEGFARLGWIHEYALGVPQDLAKATRLYSDAARLHDPVGALRLGGFYRDGVAGLQKDVATACQLFQQGAQAGLALAQGELGVCYYTGQGLPRDPQAAFGWFLRAAEAGVVRAQEFVGEMYERGQGVGQSDAKAVEWYRTAALKNDPYAMFQLGAHLRLGTGVKWNEAEAMQWFQKAADLGEVASMTSLGMGYVNGLGGGRQDYGLAARWFGEAARHRPLTSDQEYSVGWAQVNLGVLYERGWGVPQNPEQARRLYMQAAGNHDEFVARMGRTYLAVMKGAGESPRGEPSPRASEASSSILPTLIVGGLGMLLLSSLLHSRPSSSSSDTTYFDWAPGTSYEDESMRRMQVGCFWDEATYINYGTCMGS
jgi:hypothetical protein